MMIKVKKKNEMAFAEQAEKCQTQSLLVILVRGKIMHKASFSSTHEPGRLILQEVVLEMAVSAQKTDTTVVYSSKDLRENQVSDYKYCSHLSALRLTIILSHLCIKLTVSLLI